MENEDHLISLQLIKTNEKKILKYPLYIKL